MSVLATFIKAPDEVLDYSLDWTLWLSGDTLSTSTWTVPLGLTAVTSSFTTKITTQWISGGTLGTSLSVINEVTTAGGRTGERTILLQIQAR